MNFDRKETNLHEQHRQRIRKKALEYGLGCLEDHELLELLLFFSLTRINTNEIAHKLLDTFGSLQNVLEASPEELKSVPGIGDSSAALILALRSACERYSQGVVREKTPIEKAVDLEPKIHAFIEKNIPSSYLLICLDAGKEIRRIYDFQMDGKNSKMLITSLFREMARSYSSSFLLVSNDEASVSEPTERDKDIAVHLLSLLRENGLVLWDYVAVHSGKIFYLSKYIKNLFPNPK